MQTECCETDKQKWHKPSHGREVWHSDVRGDMSRHGTAFLCRRHPKEATFLVTRREHRHVPYQVRQGFIKLRDQWKTETAFMSSDTDIVLNSSYQRIIGMGKSVLPLILKDLKENGGAWFWALRHISRENPIEVADAGKTKKMKEAWLRWGQEQRYL